jgi:hypothetical protein
MEYANCTCDIELVAGEEIQYTADVVYPSDISIFMSSSYSDLI